MPTPSFTAWLEHRPPEVPDAGSLALAIARAGTAGMSLDRLSKVIQASPETIEAMLRAMVRARQVAMLRVGGELRYRVAG